MAPEDMAATGQYELPEDEEPMTDPLDGRTFQIAVDHLYATTTPFGVHQLFSLTRGPFCCVSGPNNRAMPGIELKSCGVLVTPGAEYEVTFRRIGGDGA